MAHAFLYSNHCHPPLSSSTCRLIRCDGTLLVCMSSLSAYVRKGTISEYDFLESPHDVVKKDLYSAIRDYYPPGTAISSLARNLISVGKNGTTPDPESKIYFVPKVLFVSHFPPIGNQSLITLTFISVDYSCF